MGTHGLYGFIYKGKLYLMFCHYDGYLEGLGLNLLKEIKYIMENNLLDVWIHQLENIKLVVDEDRVHGNYISDIQHRPRATDAEIASLKKFTMRSVISNEPWTGETKWYYLLNGTQGSFMEVLGCGYLLAYVYTGINKTESLSGEILATSLIKEYMNSLDSNYMYILDLDHMKYHVYTIHKNKVNEEKHDLYNLPNEFAGKDVGNVNMIRKMISDGDKYDANGYPIELSVMIERGMMFWRNIILTHRAN